jgi:release factor glutamine methyltransferase
MTTFEAQQQLTTQLTQRYDPREAANIADWVMEYATGWKKIDRIVHKQSQLQPALVAQLEQYTRELLQYKPVQYVLHQAWFFDMALYVDEQVLIPRPETEELVAWVTEDVKRQMASERSAISNAQHEGFSYLVPPISYLSILDIGTGSGCIPIALKRKLPAAMVYACDVSEGALDVARKNAADQKAAIQFFQTDFLDTHSWAQLPETAIIVSNPPYIPQQDEASMRANVLQYEPHLALFVPDQDPLLFYRNIALFAQQKLQPGGAIYAEIHEDLGEATKALFHDNGFINIELKQDMQGKDRMIKAQKQ